MQKNHLIQQLHILGSHYLKKKKSVYVWCVQRASKSYEKCHVPSYLTWWDYEYFYLLSFTFFFSCSKHGYNFCNKEKKFILKSYFNERYIQTFS